MPIPRELSTVPATVVRFALYALALFAFVAVVAVTTGCSGTPSGTTVRRVSCAVGCRACDAINAVCGCDTPTSGGETDAD